MTTKAGRVAGCLAPALAADVTDAELLHRFTTERNDAAFAALVSRHGPMVFGVCRRVLGDWHLAEDAFQASFLVLARRASDISPPSAIAGWLHGVAYNVAKNARRLALRRIQHERTSNTASFPEPAETTTRSDWDLPGVLDDELHKLPCKYRDLLVACDLEGRSRAPVAEAMGIPEGTLSSRLTTARKMLAVRLARRGVAPVLVASILAGDAVFASEIPRSALASAARMASSSSDTVPEAVATLASGAIRAMTTRALLPYCLLVLSTSVTLAAVTTLPPNPAVLDTQTPVILPPIVVPVHVAAREEPKPLPKGPNKLLFYRSGHLTLVDPEGIAYRNVSEDRGDYHPGDALLSPDGTKIAYLVQLAKAAGEKSAPRRKLYVRGVYEKEPGTDLDIECQYFAWSAYGTEIACCQFEDGPGKKVRTTHHIIKLETKEKTPVKLPEDHILTDWSRDGKYFLTTHIEDTEKAATLHLMNRDGTEKKVLTDAKQFSVIGRLSPDGKRVLYHTVTFPPKDTEKTRQPTRELVVLDIATGKVTRVEDQPLNGELQSYCWSPDGKKIAYSWREVHVGKPEDVVNKETESFLVVCDPDGKNQKTIATEKAQGQWTISIGHVDWR
jgi:RNA polymerase sigma factor (sigma-70 family)